MSELKPVAYIYTWINVNNSYELTTTAENFDDLSDEEKQTAIPLYAIPKGYQLAPIEPTKEMMIAAWNKHHCNDEGALIIYKAMLKAAKETNQ